MAENISKLVARAYQLEMLEASMQRNIIAVMATGTGKTNIAAMRIEVELKRTPDKMVWFTVPTKPLADQQCDFLASQLAEYQARTLTGDDKVEYWKNQSTWDSALLDINIVVSTPQVLLDALSNAFVRLRNISLLVFDEAHHGQKDSPVATIMRKHYHTLKLEDPNLVPHILGLSATIRTSRKTAGFEKIEELLDAQCHVPTASIDEYTAYVNAPRLIGIEYDLDVQTCSELYLKLHEIVMGMDFRQDPVYRNLKQAGDERSRQKLAKWEQAHSSTNTKDMIALKNNAEFLLINLGSWAADCFIKACISKWHHNTMAARNILDNQDESLRFVDDLLFPLRQIPESLYNTTKISKKVQALINFLAAEYHPELAVIVFVERRSTAYALHQVLSSAPELHHYRASTFVGSTSTKSGSLIELSDVKQQKKNFAEFRAGSQHICIATSVAEEGIDIQAVNVVVRFDDPKVLKSLIQSRGRARRHNSKFVYFYSSGATIEHYRQLLTAEREDDEAMKQERDVIMAANDLDTEDTPEYKVEITGAKLLYSNAVTHLQHFCDIAAKIPPVYVLSGETGVNMSAKVILPACVPVSLQTFHSARSWHGEKAARRDAAFQAYKALHKARLVTDHLVPIQFDTEKKKQTENQSFNYELEHEFDVWSSESAPSICFVHEITFSHALDRQSRIYMAIPRRVDHQLRFALHGAAQKQITITVKAVGEVETTDLVKAMDLTKQLFAAAFDTGTAWQSLGNPSSIPFVILPEDGFDSGSKNVDQTFSQFVARYGISILRQPLFMWQNGQRYPRPRLWQPETGLLNTEAHFTTIKVQKIRKLQLHIAAPRVNSISIDSPKLHDMRIDDCSAKGLLSILGPGVRLIPSILHMISLALRAQDARDNFFGAVGFGDAEFLTPALVAVSASGSLNYERLEFLGDAYLKFRVSLQLFHDDPLSMEGNLTHQVHELVGNVRLHQYAIQSGLAKFVSTTLPAIRHWRLPQLSQDENEQFKRSLNSKTLADVVESIVAAAVLEDQRQGTCDLRSTAVLSMIFPEVEWLSPTCVTDKIREQYPRQSGHPLVDMITQMSGYTFSRPSLLREALTHSASQPGSQSLDRLEFLGDAVLDWVVKTKLSKYEDLSPGCMTVLRHAVVSHTYLAYRALKVCTERRSQDILQQGESFIAKDRFQTVTLTDLLVFHNSRLRDPIKEARSMLEDIESNVEATIASGIFPWTLLRSLDVPKVCSDMVESLMAAIYIDSGGDLRCCEKMAHILGILPLIDRMVEQAGFEARTPSTILREYCATYQLNVDIQPNRCPGSSSYMGRVVVSDTNGTVLDYTGKQRKCDEEAKSVVAEEALGILKDLLSKVEIDISDDSMERVQYDDVDDVDGPSDDERGVEVTGS